MKTAPDLVIPGEVRPVVAAVLTGMMADHKYTNDLMQKLSYDIGHDDGYNKGFREGVAHAQEQMRAAQGFVQYAMGNREEFNEE
jgi:hypothetical protein